MAAFQMRLNCKKDADILRWLDEQENKTHAVKEALRTFIAGDASHSEPAHVDLCSIRAVFEAVLDERLRDLVFSDNGSSPQSEDRDAAAKLDAMF